MQKQYLSTDRTAPDSGTTMKTLSLVKITGETPTSDNAAIFLIYQPVFYLLRFYNTTTFTRTRLCYGGGKQRQSVRRVPLSVARDSLLVIGAKFWLRLWRLSRWRLDFRSSL